MSLTFCLHQILYVETEIVFGTIRSSVYTSCTVLASISPHQAQREALAVAPLGVQAGPHLNLLPPWPTAIISLAYCHRKHCMKTRNSAITDKPRDAFRGQSRYGLLLVFYSNFVSKTILYHFERFDLETRVRSHSMSSKLIPFDRTLMTSHRRSIVIMALSGVISAIFNEKNIATLKSRSRVN